MLEGKKILLAVTGSIAVYKSAYLVRLLVQAGAEVKVVMTPGSLEFITPLTFSALSGHPVHSDFTENRDSGTWVNHVHLALWADLLIVAPTSANTLSRMAHGASENFMLAVYMSVRCPVLVAPAMDHDMYLHPATLENVRKLKEFGHLVLDAPEGPLASGLSGNGRMAEPDDILEAALRILLPTQPLAGRTALVSSGPTYEPLDPVRFIGNYSSGKMGAALANALAEAGARVILVIGPSHQVVNHPMVQRVDVRTADEMFAACTEAFRTCDLAVLAAAVADYKPASVFSEKLKKNDQGIHIDLVPNVDIAFELGKRKQPHQRLVGFALETEQGEENAIKKMAKKNLDMIVLNAPADEGGGIGSDTNKITLLWPDNKKFQTGLKQKSQLATAIVQHILNLW